MFRVVLPQPPGFCYFCRILGGHPVLRKILPFSANECLQPRADLLHLSIGVSSFGIGERGSKTRADYIAKQEFKHLLAALMPPNRLALEISLATGLRISDVLNMRTAQLAERMTVRELKTGKNRRVRLPLELYQRCLSQAGKVWVFEGRTDWKKHRTRQAVYKDIKRTAALFRLPHGLQISPHTARKVYAVAAYQQSGSLRHVQQLLQHSDEAVTMLYAMADEMTARRMGGQRRNEDGN